MKKLDKRSLVWRGVIRSVATVGVVTGLCFLYPPFGIIYIAGGYGWVLFSMKYTANKMKKLEEGIPEPTPAQIRAFYKGEWVPEEEPQENIYEKAETKLINFAIEKTPIAINKIKIGVINVADKLKKSKLIIRRNHQLLNENQDTTQTTDEKNSM